MIRAGQYTVRFWHRRPTPNHEMFGYALAITICCVETPSGLKIEGTARCSLNDQFCRETGRKISLKRAMHSLPKPIRAEIWKAYFSRKSAN